MKNFRVKSILLLAGLFIGLAGTVSCGHSVGSIENLEDSPLKALRKVYFPVASAVMTEGSFGLFTVALDSKYEEDTVVDISVVGASGRLQNLPSSLIVPKGSLTASFVLQTIDDSIAQGNITFSVLISSSNPDIIFGTSRMDILLLDNDVLPTLAFTATTSSNNESAGTVSVGLTLSQAYSSDVTVSWTLSGTATLGAGSDYVINTTAPLTIPAGQTTANISVTINDDATVELNETLILTLNTPTNATLGTNTSHTMTIVDNDAALSINNVTVLENAGTATFTISLAAASPQNVSVSWATAAGTALAGTNYTTASGTATITAGNTSTTVVVNILDTAALCEGDRLFYVDLTSPVNAQITTSQGVGTIQENDYPSMSIAAATVLEGQVAVPAVTLSQACNVDITFSYSTSSGTATGGTDYATVTGQTAMIPAGDLNGYAGVSTFTDSVIDNGETLTVTISSPNYGSIGTASATVTITDTSVIKAVATDVVQVGMGVENACVVTSGGAIKCWGRNDAGQVGIGSTVPSIDTPTQVTGISSGATKVAMDGYYSQYNGFACAVVSGAAKCWGYGIYGGLGNGGTSSQATPVNVTGLSSGVTDIDTGYFHACAVVSGAAKCWGRNAFGELGDGTTTDSSVPVNVVGLSSGVVAIAAGTYSSCAVLATGTIKCWGYNATGQLGNGTTTDSSVPVDVSGIASGATKVAISMYHACAIVSGAAKCWGRNYYGELGDSTNNDSLVPVSVTGLGSGVTDLSVFGDGSAGLAFSCAVKSGGAKCWGANNSSGYIPIYNLGDGTYTNSNVPVDVSGLTSGVSAIGAGDRGACAVMSTGDLKCWGTSPSPVLGRVGSLINIFPADISNLFGFSTISTGGFGTSCGVISGAAKCWGNNYSYAVGDGTNTHIASPTQVTGLTSGISKVVVSGQAATGVSHACALSSGGALSCWGANLYGQVGNGAMTAAVAAPFTVFASGVQDVIVAGGEHTCAIMTTGGLKCWGRNDRGQLGNNSITSSSVPVDVTGLTSGVTAVAAGQGHTCALLSGGTVKCWGMNSTGELGQGTTGADQLTPIAVPGLSSVTDIAATGVLSSGGYTCAVAGGGAKCWGKGGYGQLGNSAYSDQSSPVSVTGLGSGVAKVSVNGIVSCARLKNGNAKCWGYGYYGAIGNGTTGIYNAAPQSITGISGGVIDISVGTAVCALLAGNSVKCWQSNADGAFGIGYFNYSSTPVSVLFP